MIRSNTLAMERVDAAGFAKEMPGRVGMKLVFSKSLFTFEKREIIFMNFHHQGILAAADGTVAGGEFWKIGGDFKNNTPAMAGSPVRLFFPVTHSVMVYCLSQCCVTCHQADALVRSWWWAKASWLSYSS